jgi:hypothetical protein
MISTNLQLRSLAQSQPPPQPPAHSLERLAILTLATAEDDTFRIHSGHSALPEDDMKASQWYGIMFNGLLLIYAPVF